MVTSPQILIIGAIIAAIIGIPTIFTLQGEKSFWEKTLDSISGKNITVANETFEIPTNETKFDIVEWIKEIPVKDVVDAIVTGFGGIISWLAKLVVGLANAFISKFGIPIVLPNWFGILVLIFISGLMLAKSIQGLSEFGYTFFIGVMIILFIAMIVGILFIYLGILR